MRWQRPTCYIALLLAWGAIAAWQWQEYGRQRESARQTLQRAADAVMNALVGGVLSHRRIGYFFEDQVQGALDELVKSKDVLAAAVARGDGQILVAAGQPDLLGPSAAIVEGPSWETAGLRFTARFQLSARSGGPYGGGLGLGGGGPGGGGPGGRGPGGGGPSGRGRGGGPWWLNADQLDTEGPFAGGGQFAAILLLDRTEVDFRCRRAAWARASVVAASGLVLVCLALVWRATVRLADARGRERLLNSEARHLRELSQAAAGLAHETRNPLGLIRGWTQRLSQSGLDSAEHRQQAQAVVEECDRVTARINQFLAFARPCDPKPETVPIAQLAEELAVLLGPDLGAKSLTLDHASLAADETIRADREMLRQALFNLVQNAVQSAPEGTTVGVSLRRGHNGRARIEVADRGPGVADDAVESLFTPYFTTRPNGTGLGLAIVRRIATAHGWQSGYAPRDGGGSIFWLDRMYG